MKCLNLGCGSRFHPDWTNIDWFSCDPRVKAHDLSAGIPFPEKTFDVVYQSHILEHFPKDGAFFLLQECYRVLKIGGIIRVVVPDLEQITRMYLLALEKVSQGDSEWEHHYDWMMLEMYDQVVRDHPGGAMRVYLEREFIPNEEFVCKRLGGEAQRIIQVCRMKMSAEEVQHSSSNNKLVCSVQSFLSSIRENCLKIFLGMEDYRALKLGQFRLGGEVHQWMYDHYSLTKLLSKVGFNNLKPVGPAESQIPHWSAYSLDTETDGTAYKPDSLYIEAKRCADRPS